MPRGAAVDFKNLPRNMAPMPTEQDGIRARVLSVPSEKDLSFSQAQMDALSSAELARFEEIVEQRAALAGELRDLVAQASRRGRP